MSYTITNDEIKQVCPKAGCESINFRAALNRSVDRADYGIAMISCSECNTVVGVLPMSEVWKDVDKNS
jgi:hypothetical protein